MTHSSLTDQSYSFSSRIRSIDVISIMLALSCIVMGVFFYTLSDTRSALVIPLLGALFVMLAWAWYRFRGVTDASVERRMFPIALICLALMYGLVFPPESVPDGAYHYKVSYYCANLIEHSDNPHLIRAEDEELLSIANGVPVIVDKGSISPIKRNLSAFDSNEELIENADYSAFIDGLDITSTFVQQKLAPALGVFLGKVIGLNAFWVYTLGMVFNLLYGVVLIMLSVRITPIGKKIFMAIALLPMTLHLLGSHSYDVGTLGLAFLLTALLLRAMRREEKITIKELLCIGIVGCLLAPCKTVYSLIIFLTVLIPASRFPSKGRSIAVKAIIIAIPFVVIALLQLPGILTMLGITQPAAHAAEASSGEGSIQPYVLGDLVTDPGFAVSLFLNTFFVKGWEYLLTFVGSALGWLQGNLIAPDYFTLMLLLLVGLSVLRSPEDKGVLPPKARIILFIIFAIAVFAIMLALCLDHTPNTYDYIEGVQGRYFLQIAPLILVALRGSAFCVNRRMTFALIISFVALNATYIGFIFTRLL